MQVLAIRAGGLGDTIVTLPAVAALAALPARVELVGTSPYIELALGRGLASAVHSIDRARFRGLYEERSVDGELRDLLERFDLVVAWSRVRALHSELEGLGIRLLQGDALPPPGVHASDHLLGVLEPLGIRGPAGWPRVEVDYRARARERSEAATPSFGDQEFMAIHPGSGSARKNWPAERFEALARMGRDAGLRVVWIQGEADRDIVPPLVRAVPGAVARELPLGELSRVLFESAVFVGNDSGVSHLAAAVGTPTLAVFRSTDPAQWAPRGPRVRVVGAGASPEQVWGFATDLMTGH